MRPVKWIATHSFTLFLPKAQTGVDRHIYPYQAYYGQHTLQQWLHGKPMHHLCKMSLEEYNQQLKMLEDMTLSSKKREGIYTKLFLLKSGLMDFSHPYRIKFKVIQVNPAIAMENLRLLQQWINTTCPGATPAEQIATYNEEAKQTLSQALQGKLRTHRDISL